MNQRDLKMVKNAIEQIAKREGVSIDDVREQMKIAIFNGFASKSPLSRTYWQSIPCEAEIPTPEEFILFSAKAIIEKA